MADAPVENGSKTRPHYSTAYLQAKQLQQLIFKDAQAVDLKPLIRAGIARAFCELEECKRKLRMKPLPKPVDVQYKSKHKAKPSGPAFSEE